MKPLKKTNQLILRGLGLAAGPPQEFVNVSMYIYIYIQERERGHVLDVFVLFVHLFTVHILFLEVVQVFSHIVPICSFIALRVLVSLCVEGPLLNPDQFGLLLFHVVPYLLKSDHIQPLTLHLQVEIKELKVNTAVVRPIIGDTNDAN